MATIRDLLSALNRWIVHTERTLTQEVPAPPSAVRAFYTDLDNMKLVHPLVVSVRTTGRTETTDGYRQSYRVQDRIRLGPFTVRIGYRARLNVPYVGEVITEARQFPGVRLYGAVTFDQIDRGTHVSERIRIAAPRPLAAMTVSQAVKAHVTMLTEIRRHFESAPAEQ